MTHKSAIIAFFIFLFISNFVSAQDTKLTRYTYTRENSFWLDMIDRGSVMTYKPGVIRDYSPHMDNEYWIDYNSYLFSILDDSNYVQSKNGFRALAGSINSSRFFTEGSFKLEHQIEDKGFFKVEYTREENYQSEHDEFLVTLGRDQIADQKLGLYVMTSLDTYKEDLDLILGSEYEPIENLKIDFQLALLDVINNLMSDAITRKQLIEKRVFDSQPFAFRLRSSYEWNDYRFELFGATNTPEKSKITFENREFDDFTEEIKYYYAGFKAEKQWNDNLTTGLMGDLRQATHIRVSRGLEDNFNVEEFNGRIGVYALYRWSQKLRFESEVNYTKMKFQKGDNVTNDLDTNDWGVDSKVMAYWLVKTKMELSTGLLYDRRVIGVIYDDTDLSGTNVRLTLGIRYQTSDNFYFKLTTNIGLENFYSYDGSSLQFQYLW